jgi:peptidoglycan-associated lipoprotein
MSTRHAHRTALTVSALVMVAGLAGCGGRVKQEDFNSEMAKIRQEMQASDQAMNAKLESATQADAAQDAKIEALEKDLEAFKGEYQVSIEKTRGMLTFNVPVHFEFDNSELRESDRPVLDKFASVVNEHYSGSTVTVEGFADPSGSAAYNMELGQARADAVKEYLGSSLSGTTVRAVSYGEARNRQVTPGAHGPGEEGIENRRVALVIDYTGASAAPAAYAPEATDTTAMPAATPETAPMDTTGAEPLHDQAPGGVPDSASAQ